MARQRSAGSTARSPPDPDFALAHIARARLLQLQARMPEARAEAAHAQSFAEHVTPRERRHIEVIALSINGAARDALTVVHGARRGISA